MAKDIFWVIKGKDGKLKVDSYYEIHDTRKELRENGIMEKGDKAVKVKLIEVTE